MRLTEKAGSEMKLLWPFSLWRVESGLLLDLYEGFDTFIFLVAFLSTAFTLLYWVAFCHRWIYKVHKMWMCVAFAISSWREMTTCNNKTWQHCIKKSKKLKIHSLKADAFVTQGTASNALRSHFGNKTHGYQQWYKYNLEISKQQLKRPWRGQTHIDTEWKTLETWKSSFASLSPFSWKEPFVCQDTIQNALMKKNEAWTEKTA